MKVLLFDIDGTLMLSGGAGLRAMNEAFFRIYGVRDTLLHMDLAGRTDTSIIKEALNANQLPFHEKKLCEFQELYFSLIEREIDLPANGKRPMPAVPELLETLSHRDQVFLGLLTGNWEKSGRIKLDHFNLGRYFNFGAFSDDSEIRTELLPFAVKRFEQKYHISPEPQDVYVIGDTPADIQCAKPHGAISVAVATSKYKVDDLKKHYPDHVFNDLADGTVLQVLG
jgi:phosphoglycolate phosphatase